MLPFTEINKIESFIERIEMMDLDEVNISTMNEINSTEKMIIDITRSTDNSSVEERKDNSYLSKLRIQILLRKSQLLGKDGEWKQIIETTDVIMSIMDNLGDDVGFDYRSKVEATSLGYKGFALMKKEMIQEAIMSLSRSYELRMNKKKSVALVNEQKGTDNKKINQREKRETLQVERALVACCQRKGIDAPLPPLTKFSRTAHLFNAGGTAVTSDDLVMSRDDVIYNEIADGTTTLYVEEKVDGANFGLSLTADGKVFAQNRSHYVSSGDHAQFSPLTAWIEEHRSALINILNNGQGNRTASQGLILYGEWVVAKHSIPYHRLPGHFIAFDIYDRKLQRFWSRSRFHSIMKGNGIPVVPIIFEGTLKSFELSSKAKTPESFRNDLVNLLETPSHFRVDGGKVEGIILRVDDNCADEQGHTWLRRRLKVVRPDFIGGCAEGHWSRREIEKQIIDYDFAQEYLSRCFKCAINNGEC